MRSVNPGFSLIPKLTVHRIMYGSYTWPKEGIPTYPQEKPFNSPGFARDWDLPPIADWGWRIEALSDHRGLVWFPRCPGISQNGSDPASSSLPSKIHALVHPGLRPDRSKSMPEHSCFA